MSDMQLTCAAYVSCLCPQRSAHALNERVTESGLSPQQFALKLHSGCGVVMYK